jgi:hypothetical protein
LPRFLDHFSLDDRFAELPHGDGCRFWREANRRLDTNLSRRHLNLSLDRALEPRGTSLSLSRGLGVGRLLVGRILNADDFDARPGFERGRVSRQFADEGGENVHWGSLRMNVLSG